MPLIQSIHYEAPWLRVSFSKPLEIVSWAVHRPGFVLGEQIVWREVRNSDLSLDVDPQKWLTDELTAKGQLDAVTMLTSCDLSRYCVSEAQVDDTKVTAIITAGLSNAERVGRRVDWSKAGWGTINLAVVIEAGLTHSAFLEAISIAAEARTAAVSDADIMISTGRATGTGTDCIAIAAPSGTVCYAGLHTALGEAIGQSVYEAATRAIEHWKASKAAQMLQ
nr:adenosylcobinamide amidohydrolase [uncultured Cohaesibacter sp.]